MARPDTPPADFNQRTLPLEIYSGGQVLYRSFRLGTRPLYFTYGDAYNRFDDPNGQFGVCYCAMRKQGAFVETMLRHVQGPVVAFEEAEQRACAEIEVRETLNLVPFYGRHLPQLRATAAVTAGPVTVAQQWAQAIHDHPDQVDGIIYCVRHDNSERGVALFDRCHPKIVAGARSAWNRDPDFYKILEHYQAALL